MVVDLKIRNLEKNDEKAWDNYVLNSDNSTFYHQISWKNAIEKTYGHKQHYLIAEENGNIKGILPLFLMESMIFGKKLISVPFGPYGGVCADSTMIEQALIEEAKRIVEITGVDYLEVRNLFHNGNDLITNDVYVTLILKLERNPKLLWQKFSRKVRNATRKATKAGLEVEMGDNYISDFYRIYARNMRDLGSPVHSYALFKNLQSEFHGQTDIAVVHYEDKIIACIFLLYFKDTIISGWASSNKSYQRFNPNNLLYWKMIEYGCEKGYRYFDFGRSIVGSGTYRFKKPWGADVNQLYYQYYLNNVGKIPNSTHINPKRKIFARMWRKLPVSVTKLAGPKLRGKYP